MMNSDETAIPNPSVRWFHPTPGRLLVVLLALEGILFLCNWFRWTPKGWAVLIAIAALSTFLLSMLLWWLAALLFHWRFQFSLRTLLMLTVAVAVLCSWLTVNFSQARKQREVVESMQKLRWAVGYDYELDSNGYFKKQLTPITPACIRKLFGDDFFSDVLLVYVMETAPPGVLISPAPGRPAIKDFPDAEVQLIEELPKIQVLDFTNRIITDRVIVCLERLTQLKDLRFKNTDISGTGLRRIGALTQLRELSISETETADADLEHLEGLKRLRSLVLCDNGITDAGADHLEKLTQLEKLTINRSNITDSGLKFLRGMHQLRSLDIEGNKVHDAGLGYLQGLSQLEDLNLWGLNITDAGLQHLQGLTGLKKLELFGTQVTGEGLIGIEVGCISNDVMITRLSPISMRPSGSHRQRRNFIITGAMP